MARKLRPKLSRAKWKGSRYLRKESNTWRSNTDGRVYSNATSDNSISFEPTKAHPYGSKSRTTKSKANKALKLFRPKTKRL